MPQPQIPANVLPLQHLICAKAISYEGIRETPRLPNRGPQVDHFQPSWLIKDPMREGLPWCASFVTTVWFEALGSHPLGSLERSADAIQDRSLQLGLWHASPDALPCPGDAFVVVHGVDRPRVLDKGHTGIVICRGFDAQGNPWIETIEGNVRNGCRHGRRRVITDREPRPEEILGFARVVPGALPGDARKVLGGEVFGSATADR